MTAMNREATAARDGDGNKARARRRPSRAKWLILFLIPFAACLYLLARERGLITAFGTGARARAAISRGEALLKKGRHRQSLAVISPVPEDGPWRADLLAVKGLALAGLGDVEASRQALEQSLALKPNQTMADKVLAAIYFSRSEHLKGIECLEKAAKLDPGDFRPWYAVGEAFVRLGQTEEAAKAFGYALDRKRDHLGSRIGLLSILVVTRPPEESAPLLASLLKDRPDDPKVQVLAAWHARAQGRAKLALEHAEQAVALDPDLVEAVVLRAQLNHAAGRADLALADIERAVELDPNNMSALSLLAQLQAATGKAEESRATLARHRRALERSEQIRKLNVEIEQRPQDPEPRWKLGRLAAEGGLKHLASQSYQAALAIDPNCQPARQGLAALGTLAPEPLSMPLSPSLLPSAINP
jgi:tetratricopeptide (TPR) repeat protein